jgi:hypothetical protein
VSEAGYAQEPFVQRARIALYGVVAFAATTYANLYAALYVGNRRCGDSAVPEPVPGSPRGEYCAFFEDPDDGVTFLLGLLVYAPVLIVLGGAVWATLRGDWRVLARSVVVAAAWLAAFMVPAALLPAS